MKSQRRQTQPLHRLSVFYRLLCQKIPLLLVLLLLLLLTIATTTAAAAAAASDEKYRVYPTRTQEEAAVIEWGHSAIISALDVSVAHFGPQTTQAALFEVETMPTLASPINGVMKENDDDNEVEIEEDKEDNSNKPKIAPLENASDLIGNVVVMTNAGNLLSGVEMARIAQLSGAAALIVVNIDEENPDDIYRMEIEEGEEEMAAAVDIPVVMMSYNSATVLTSATVTPETKPEEVVNHGMPERIRLYAGGDRPFFEDVVAADPAVYLIHNLLTAAECEALIQQAAPRLQPITKDDPLQFLQHYERYHNIQRVMLWQGMLQSAPRKAIEERIEQATGFPADHFSDFIVERLDKGARLDETVDQFDAAPAGGLPMATLTIFLNEPPSSSSQAGAVATSVGGEIVYPAAGVKVRPQLGLSVIHHNMNEQRQFDPASKHAVLEYTGDEPLYVARKYVLAEPYGNGRRVALPVYAAPFGGRLPVVFSQFHDWMVERFGKEKGGAYFDKVCVFIPLLFILGAVQYIVQAMQKKWSSSSSSQEKKDEASSSSGQAERRSKKKKVS